MKGCDKMGLKYIYTPPPFHVKYEILMKLFAERILDKFYHASVMLQNIKTPLKIRATYTYT